MRGFHKVFFLFPLSSMKSLHCGFQAGPSVPLPLALSISLHTALYRQTLKLLQVDTKSNTIYQKLLFFLQTSLSNILMPIWKMLYYLAKPLAYSKHSNII